MKPITQTLGAWALLLALLVSPGCGKPSSPAPEPEAGVPSDAAPEGPVVPEAGVVLIHVRSHETLPSLNAIEDPPLTDADVLGAVQPILVTLPDAQGLGDALVCEVLPGSGRVRFWVARGEGVDEAQAVALAERLAEAFLASAESRFQGRIEVALLGLGKELEAVAAERTEAQQTLRDYLELNRGVPETRESRREQAELERELSRVNDRASRVQDLIAELERLREKGQPWYRRQR
jgi:hypothetical protein